MVVNCPSDYIVTIEVYYLKTTVYGIVVIKMVINALTKRESFFILLPDEKNWAQVGIARFDVALRRRSKNSPCIWVIPEHSTVTVNSGS